MSARRGIGRTEWVGLAIGLLCLLCLLAPMGLVLPLELLFFLAFGWALFLVQVLPQVEADWSSAAVGAAALLLFAAGLHWLLRSLSAGWRLRWTLSAVAIVLIMFVAGIAMVGITHQVAWMTTAPTPLVEGSERASRRMQSMSNAKQIALAVQHREDAKGHLPPGMLTAADGQALHGWQTLLLPYFEQASLFHSINLKTPWTAEENKVAFSSTIRSFEMPYAGLPRKDERGFAMSHYASNVHLIGGTQRRTRQEITDGTSQTILCGEAAGSYQPWGSPRNWRDPAGGINRSPGGFGSPAKSRGAVFAFADGSTVFISEKVDPEVLRALATPAGGDKVRPDDY